MDDKFILMGLDDERSKKVANVLGNKTCKKIIDYLAETKEASEKDVSDALGIPINTVEYNLKKLLESGLVEKTKNFFWSKKGRKIPMYKLAKKHIVISPKSKPNLTVLKTIIPIIIAAAFLLILFSLLLQPTQKTENELKQFQSLSELKTFIEEHRIKEYTYETGVVGGITKSSAESSDYSTTNIQVEGVDEADIVKNDGKFIYSVSGEKVIILNAYPAEDLEILSEINFKENVLEIFINEDKLIIFTQEYGPIIYEQERCVERGCVYNTETYTHVYIYDTSEKESPELENKITVSGNYLDSRMIEDYVYVIANQPVYSDVVLPVVEKDNDIDIIQPEEISYSDVEDTAFQYTIILGINIQNSETSEKTLLTGTTQTIYVSQNNIYTTYTKYHNWYNNSENEEKTIINKFSVDKDEIEYKSTGEVPGIILNQFSMDEYKGNFRIATTKGEVWGTTEKSQNNLYVLDNELELVGKLEGLAPGERIYSVRFMGEKAYLVTFKKIDPLFVIDLSKPENPEVLGKLKIPGYSDYLHPYDENHIIGVGKNTVEASEELIQQRNLDFAWYQGIKIAIFDVTDVENPIELHKIVIGDRGTDSEALGDHKAFLFDKEKELLVLPITLAEIKGEKTQDNQYGEFTFQGAYVYNVNLEEGFEFKGRITHYEEDEVEDKSGYYWYGNRNVRRSLYMDDVLYTISNEFVKANDLDDLDEVNYVKF